MPAVLFLLYLMCGIAVLLSAKTGEYVGTCYYLYPGEYQLIGAQGEYFFAEFTIKEAGRFVFELSEIN